MERKIIQIEERVPVAQWIPLSFQHMFAMFGASVLVPIVFGINPAIVLLMNGIGTLLFIYITKGRSPAYLGSSFAFLAPGLAVIGAMGFEYARGGFVVVGLVGCLVALVIWKFGIGWINIVLPPAAMGPVVALIGLELASFTVTGGSIGANIMTDSPTTPDVIVFLVTIGTAVMGSVLFRKFFAVIPILIAMIVGYTTALFFNMIDFAPVIQAHFFALPEFGLPKFNMTAILTILPVFLVVAAEHIGHQLVTSEIVGRDLLKDPGLHRTLFADSFSTIVSGVTGAVPTTTYGENIGVMAVTKVYSVWVIGGAAVLSIITAFIGPFSALISTIPGNVIGGVSFLLYGMIGAAGIRLIVDARVDYGKAQNLILTSIVFVTGLSGLAINVGGLQIKGMTLACIVGVVLSLTFYICEKQGWIAGSEDEAKAEEAK